MISSRCSLCSQIIPLSDDVCSTCCIYSEFQIKASLKYLYTLYRTQYTWCLLVNIAYIYIYWCLTIWSCFLLSMRYIPQEELSVMLGCYYLFGCVPCLISFMGG